MKKFLCFLAGVLFVISGLYAQNDCVNFQLPNLYPGNTTQKITLRFDQTNLPAEEYAIHYDFYKKTESEEEFHLMTDMEMNNDFDLDATTFLARFSALNYYGQYINQPSGYFPNGSFTTGSGNVGTLSFNYFYKSYLKSSPGGNKAELQLNLGWRSDRNYSGINYMLVIKLVSMSGGSAKGSYFIQRTNYIGGDNATVAGVIATSDTLTTIKHLSEPINDTLCYNEAFGYEIGDITLIADTINKDEYKNVDPTHFYSVFPQYVRFTTACNGRIDSIGTVNFYVRKPLTLTKSATGNNLVVCENATAGYVIVTPTGGNQPYTVYACKKNNNTYAEISENTPRVTIETSGMSDTIKGLGKGEYKLVCVDAAGCEAEASDDAEITETNTPNEYTIDGTTTSIVCHGGSTGAITITVTPNTGITAATPYTYNWTDEASYSATTQNLSNIPAGNYTVIVTDHMGCTATESFEVRQNNLIETSLTVDRCMSALPYINGDTSFSATEIDENNQIKKDVHFTANTNGCDSVVHVTVNVYANPEAVVWGTFANAVCENADLTATVNTGDHNYTQFYWTNDGTAVASTTSSATFNWTDAGTHTISANFSDEHGCRVVSADTTKEITVNPLPNTTVATKVDGTDSTMNITACAGQTVTLTAANGASYQYVWKKGETTVGNQQTLTLSDITSEVAGNYVVEITDTSAARGTNCAATSGAVTITVNTPAVTLTPMADATMCPDAEVELTASTTSPTTGTLSYQWYVKANGTFAEIDEVKNDSYVAQDINDTTIYMVAVTATVGACTATAYDTITVNVNAPSVTLSKMSDQIVCAAVNNETEIQLTSNVTSHKGTLSYEWGNTNKFPTQASFEPNNESSTTVQMNDTVEIYLKVTATIGTIADYACTVEAYDTVIINVNAPMVQLTPMADATICSGSKVTLRPQIKADSYKSAQTTYAWNTGASSDTLEVNPTAAETEYSVIVTAKVGDCTFSAYDTVTVNVLTPSVALKTLHDTTICYGKSVTLPTTAAVNSYNGTLTYEWTDGTNPVNEYTQTPNETTTYQLTVTAKLENEGGLECPAEASTTWKVNVNKPAIASLSVTPNDTVICAGGTATLIANAVSDNTITYKWNDSDETTGATLTTGTANTYTVTATATRIENEVTCTLDSVKTAQVRVLTPAITLTGIADKTVCFDNNSVTLTANVSGTPEGASVSYKWECGTPHTTIQEGAQYNEITFTATQDTIIYLTATATLTEGVVNCPANAFDTINVYVNKPEISSLTITPNTVTICEGSSATLTAAATHAGNISYSWTPTTGLNQANTDQVIATPTETTGYTVTCVDTISRNGVVCTASKTETVTVTVNDTVELHFHSADVQSSPEFCLGGSFSEITVDSANCSPLQISWSPRRPDGSITFANGIISGTVTEAGIFTYTITATSDKTPACGVEKTLTGTIIVKDTVQYTITGTLNQLLCWEDAGDTIKVTNIKNANINTSADNLGVLSGTDYVKIFRNETTPADNEEYPFTIELSSNNNCASTNKTIEGTFTVYDTVKYTITGDTTFAACVGSAITPIKITNIENGAITADAISGLPAGLTYSSTNGISGTLTPTLTTPTQDFHYTIPISHSQSVDAHACAGKTITGTIVVNDTVKLTVSGDTTQDNICLGQPITNIVFTVTNGNGGLTWNTTPAGVTATATGISGTPTAAGTYKYTYTATSNMTPACTGKTITGTIVVKDTVKLTVSGNTNPDLCLNGAMEAITFSVQNGQFATVNNTFPAGISFSMETGKISGTPTEVATKDYMIVATSDHGCASDTIHGTIKVHGLPTVNITNSYGNGEICSGVVDTLKAVVAGEGTAPYNYAWSNGATTEKNPVSTENNYKVTVTDTYGCTAVSNEFTVTVKPLPVVTISAETKTTVCKGDEVTISLNTTSGAAVAHYVWYKGEHIVASGADNATYTFTANGDSTYMVVVNTEAGCRDTATYTGSTYTLPVLTVRSVTNVQCKGQSTGAAEVKQPTTEIPYSYTWSGPNDFTQEGINRKINNVPAGSYNVTVTDGHGCSATLYEEIVITEPENALTFASVTIDSVSCFGKIDGAITVRATGGTPTSDGEYQYTLTYGSTTVDEIIAEKQFTGLAQGNYHITVGDATGQCQITKDTTVGQPEEFSIAISNITDNKDSICADGLAQYATTLTAAGNYSYTYQWQKDGVAIADSIRSGISQLSNGVGNYVYTVIATQSGSHHCTQSDNVTLSVLALPNVTITAAKDTICFGESLTLTAGGADTYQWQLNDVDLSTASQINVEQDFDETAYFTHRYTLAGTKNYGSHSCMAYNDTTIIILNPYIEISRINDTTICGNGTATLTTTVTKKANDNLTYQWMMKTDGASEPIALIDAGASITRTGDALEDTTTFYLTVTNTVGTCTKTAKDTIIVNVNNPSLTLSDITYSLNDTICYGDEVTLTVTPTYTGNISYEWNRGNETDFSGETTNALKVRPSSSGNHTFGVTATVTIGEGAYACSVNASKTAPVVVNDTVSLHFATEVNPNPTFCLGGNVSITTESSNCNTPTIAWTPNAPEGVSFNGTVISGTPTKAGTYGYTITAESNNIPACNSKQISGTITVLALPNVTITAAKDTICLGQSLTLTADGAETYKWKKNDDANYSTATTIDVTQEFAYGHEYFTHSYTLTGSNTYGDVTCSATKDTTVTILNPYVEISQINDITICGSGTATLTTTVTQKANDNLTYQWMKKMDSESEPSDLTDDGASITRTGAELGDTTTFYLTVTNTVGTCTKTAKDTIIVNVNNPTLTLSDITYNPNDTICFGNEVTLTLPTTYEGNISYSWLEGITHVEGNSNILTVRPAVGDHTYTVTATVTIGEGAYACSVEGTKSAPVVVNDTVSLHFATADIQPNPTICLGGTFNDIEVSSDNCQPLTIAWEITPNTITPEETGITFANNKISGPATKAGTFNYTITALSNKTPACNSKQISGTITVNDTARFEIAAAHDHVCAGTNDTVTLTSEGTYTYEWTYTGLTKTDISDNQKAFTAEPNSSTNYTITVNAGTGNCSNSKTLNITVDSLPRPTITANDNICISASEAQDTLTLVTETGTGYTYEWNLAGGTAIEGAGTATVKAQWAEAASSMEVSVKVTDGNNCSKTATKTITVNNITDFVINSTGFTSEEDGLHICMFNEGTLTPSVSTGVTYTWTPSDSLSGDGIEKTFKSSKKETHTYEVVGKDNSSNCVVKKNVTVNVDTVPAITLTHTDVKCYGGNDGTITATVTGGTGFEYTWKNSANETVTDLTALPSSRYYVTVTNSFGCSATANDTIKQPEELTIEVTEATNITCHDENDGIIKVAAHGGTTPYKYKWNDGSFTLNDNSKNDLSAGRYSITVKDAHNCEATVDTVIINPAQLVITADTINPKCYGDANGEIKVTVTGGTGSKHYQWNANPGNDTYDTIRTNLTAGSYTLYVEDANQCQSNRTFNLIEPKSFNVTLAHEADICDGQTTSFTATVTGEQGTDFTSLQWYNTNGAISGQTAATLSDISEAGKYWIVATQNNGVDFGNSVCTKADTVKLNVRDLPVFSISAQPSDNICLGTGYTFTVTPSEDGYSYNWKSNSSSETTEPEIAEAIGIIIDTVTVTKTYTLGTGTLECSKTMSDTVTVLPLPSATLTTTVNGVDATDNYDVTLCAGGTVVISAPDVTENEYQWFKGAENLSGETSATLTLSNVTAGEYTYTVKVTSAAHCDSTSKTVKVTVNPLPSATLATTVNGEAATDNYDVTLCVGGTVVISAPDVTGNGYQWFKGTETLSTETGRILTLSNVTTDNAGEYHVVVYNTATHCDSTSKTVKVTVNSLPSATLATTVNGETATDNYDVTLCAGGKVVISAPDVTGNEYQWFKGAENLSGETSATLTLSNVTAGEYTYTVKVTSAAHCDSTSKTVKVTVNALPTVAIESDEADQNNRICASDTIKFTASGATNYTWTGSNLTETTGEVTVFKNAAGSTTPYSISVEGTDANGCKNTANVSITVDTLPNVTVNDPSVCRNSSVTLEAAGATTYVWNPADSLTDDHGTSVNFKSATAGTFEIVVTGTDGHNCSATDTATITVNDLPGSGALASLGTKEFCKGGVTGFKVSGYNDYVWTSNPADGSLTSLTDSATFTGNTPGSYVVMVEVTDANGCKSSTSANVTVDTLPVPTITVDPAVCVNGALKFTTESTDVNNYVWTFDGEKVDSTGATLKLKWNTAGEKTVTVNYTDNNGCTATTATSKSITVHALPVVEITEGRDSSICRGSSINLHATSDQNETAFGWDNNVGSDVAQVTVTPVTNDSTFVVTGTYWPVAGTLSCASTDTITVHLKDTVKLTVANAEQTKCLGQAITDITVNYEAAELSWNPTSFTEGLTATDGTNAVTISGNITHAGTYTYVVTATSTNNCGTKEATITLTVNDTNKLSSNSELTQTICLGTDIAGIKLDTANCSLTFSPELSTKGLTYNAATATITGTPSVAESFTVTITAAPATDGCNDAKTLTFTITVLDTNKLSAPADFIEQEICLGANIAPIVLDTANCTLAFEPELSTIGLSYNAAEHQIEGTPVLGDHTITITAAATNSVNAATPCYAAKTLEVKVKVNDTVKIAATTSDDLTRKLCKGNDINEVKLWATNGTIALGSGSIPTDLTNTSNDPDTIKLNGTMNVAGTYSFYVVATGTACTTSKDSMLVTITVDTIPFVAITPNVDTVCPNADLRTATLTATAGYVNYAWSCSDDDNDNTVTVTPENNENIYTVMVTNGQNCTASASDTIRLYTPVGSAITAEPTVICNGGSSTLTVTTATDHTAATYEWVGITSAAANNDHITVSPVADSVFYVRVVDNHGCYDTAHITVNVNQLPVTNLTADTAKVCQNGTIHFTSTSGYTSYVWKDGENEVSTTGNEYNFVTTTDTVKGQHVISVQITDNKGCVKSDTLKVTVYPTPILTKDSVNVDCYNNYTASIDLTVENVETTPTYRWVSNQLASEVTDEDLQNIHAGTYNVTVTSDKGCVATESVNIEQPTQLTAAWDATNSDDQLCSGIGLVVAKATGGTAPYSYAWTGDGIVSGTETSDTLKIHNLTLGTQHAYTVTVTDDHHCTYTITPAWTVSSNRVEVYREINLGPDDSYTYNSITYEGSNPDDEGKTFEVYAGESAGACDSVIIYTVHIYGVGFYFADNFTVQHSSYRKAYLFNPHKCGDTITTSVGTDETFYAYLSTTETTLNGKRMDIKYEILLNDSPVSNDEFEETIDNLKISSYHEYDDFFYGYELDSARGEAPATTFLYQFPSNSTAYYYDYFNFEGFNNIPQKIDFNFLKPGTYHIKFYVETRTGGGNDVEEWGIYNPYVVNRRQGPIWGGRGDNPTGRDTVVARYMTVIVGGEGGSNSNGGNGVISDINDYTYTKEPAVTAYPNPTRDMLYLNISGMEGLTHITITDATGKVVAKYNEELLNSETTLNYSVAKFAQGIYFLNVHNDDTVITKKFIVTK